VKGGPKPAASPRKNGNDGFPQFRVKAAFCLFRCSASVCFFKAFLAVSIAAVSPRAQPCLGKSLLSLCHSAYQLPEPWSV
jgi:hypothetical protein